MKENPKYNIPNPCNKKWSEMELSGTNKFRNCQNCRDKVFDLRGLTKSEIGDWYKQQNSNNCIIVNANQLSRDNTKNGLLLNLRKIGIASMLIGSSVLSPNLSAQENSKLNTFVIEQTAANSDKITIQGKVKIKAFIGWKRLDDYSIGIYSGNELISELLIDNKGKFKLELDKKVLPHKFTILISAEGFKDIETKEIEAKDTMLKVFLDKRELRFVTGRFF